MNIVKIAFVDGGEAFERTIRKALDGIFEVVSTDDNPDLCIFNFCNNGRHRSFNCKKLEITGENAYPHFEHADYAITCHRMEFGKRHCRIPFFVFNKEYSLLVGDEPFKYDKKLFNRNFCSALVSNSSNANPFRINFIRELNAVRKVCSAGNACKNTPFSIPPRKNNAENLEGRFTNEYKINFISNFKFNIAMENSYVDGYVTEKITDAFAAMTIPIYWGSRDIVLDFNKDSFIYVDDALPFEENIERIIRICDDSELYMKMLTSEKVVRKDYDAVLRDFLLNVIDGNRFEHSYGNIGISR